MTGRDRKVVHLHAGKAKVPSPSEIASQLGTPVRLKTWSLIVSLFGDAILPRGGSISAISLGQVMEIIGVEPGAVRTAVSRLASDGWIERERDGRASFYRMAEFRQTAFEEAAQLIYGMSATKSPNGNWALCALPFDMSPDGDFAKSALSLSKNWYLVNLDAIDHANLPSAAMLFEGAFSRKPAWFLELLAPQEQAMAMERLIEVFAPLDATLKGGWLPEPVEALSYRCLLIHDWRRIALRLNHVPQDMLPSDWPEHDCRDLVRSIYSNLFDQSETWLSKEARARSGFLPKRNKDASQTFG